MNYELTSRSFGRVMHESYPEAVQQTLVQAASMIGPYADAFDKPGSSFLWVGDKHRLNREQVTVLVEHMTNWLRTGSLDLRAQPVEPPVVPPVVPETIDVSISVNEDCLLRGKPRDCELCPVALAIVDALCGHDLFSNLKSYHDVDVSGKIHVRDKHGTLWIAKHNSAIDGFIRVYDYDSDITARTFTTDITLRRVPPEADDITGV